MRTKMANDAEIARGAEQGGSSANL